MSEGNLTLICWPPVPNGDEAGAGWLLLWRGLSRSNGVAIRGLQGWGDCGLPKSLRPIPMYLSLCPAQRRPTPVWGSL